MCSKTAQKILDETFIIVCHRFIGHSRVAHRLFVTNCHLHCVVSFALCRVHVKVCSSPEQLTGEIKNFFQLVKVIVVLF